MALTSDTTLTPDPPPFTRLLEELRQCGWQVRPHPRLTGDAAHFQTFQGSHHAPCRVFANARGESLLAVGLEGVRLPAEDELFPRFLDISLEERMALVLARAAGGLEWLLLRTADRLDLYRLGDEVCEYRVQREEDFQQVFLPALTALARGRPRGHGPGLRYLPGAESLGGWVRHWSQQLASEMEIPAEQTERVIWKWIGMLQVCRRLQGGEAEAGHWGLHCELGEGGWTVSYDAITATDDLCRALEGFEQHFPTRLLEPEPPEFFERLRQMEETPTIDRLRAELLMHTQNRFEPETVAWLFTDLGREQNGWRREVRGVEPVRKRIHLAGWTVYAPLVCDVAAYGLSAALSDAERLAEYLAELNLYEQHRRRAERAAAHQPDLFRPHPRGIDRQGALSDGINFLYGEALRLRGVAPAERFGVGLTFLLKAVALAARLGWPLGTVDTLDELFKPTA